MDWITFGGRLQPRPFCDCIDAVQMKTYFTLSMSPWNQLDHLFRLFGAHISPSLSTLTVWFSTGLWQVTDGLHAAGRGELQLGIFLEQDQYQGLFSRGHHSLSLIFYKLYSLPRTFPSIKFVQQILTVLGSLGGAQNAFGFLYQRTTQVSCNRNSHPLFFFSPMCSEFPRVTE